MIDIFKINKSVKYTTNFYGLPGAYIVNGKVQCIPQGFQQVVIYAYICIPNSGKYGTLEHTDGNIFKNYLTA